MIRPRPPVAILLLLLLTACSEAPENVAQGYIEGDYLFIGAEHGGRIAELKAAEGEKVAAGQPLFRLDTDVEAATLAAAEARAGQARAELRDRTRGARPQRIAVLDAAIRRARTEVKLARKRLERVERLWEREMVSRERLDEAKAAYESAQARLEERRQERELAGLPDRSQRVEAARQALAAARAEADRQQLRVRERTVRAPATGIVHELVRRAGEVAPRGATVMSFLPEDARRAVFFMDQAQLARINRDQPVAIACDGCPPDLRGRIDFIAREVAFTPPVIFGPQEREHLLVRVEAAIPPEHAPELKPGQPVTVRLPQQEPGPNG
jgi:HlyD family secretion protein